MSAKTEPVETAAPATIGKYHIETWGCQMNVHDSEKLAGALELEGYRQAAAADDADVILLNTCSIREKAAEKVFGELGRLRVLKETNPGLLLGVCGCVAQQEGEQIFRRAPYVDFVIGPRSTGSLGPTLAGLRSGAKHAQRQVHTEYRLDSIQFPFDEIRRDGLSKSKAFVTIIEGCNHRCTYCIVPRTRGSEVCREMSEILAEVRMLRDKGVVEVEFLGQTVNAYRDSDGNTLAELLVATAEIDGIHRIRFTTSHPAQMTDRILDAMAEAQPKVCRYLHLPVQSGSTDVLQSMKRGYTREKYLEKIAGLRRRIPGMTFGTDVIVGFPTESENDFRETLSLLAEVQYDTVYSFTYSERPGTASLVYSDPIPESAKASRLQELQLLQQDIQRVRNQQWVGQQLEVLVEGNSKRNPARRTGRTIENRVVNFEGVAQTGDLVQVKVLSATAFSLLGERVVNVA